MNDSPKQVTYLLIFVGALGILFGVIHLVAYFSTGSGTLLADAGINTLLGLMGLGAAWLVLKRKYWAIVLTILYVLVDLIFTYFMGRGINFLSIALGSLFVGWLMVFWRRGVLN